MYHVIKPQWQLKQSQIDDFHILLLEIYGGVTEALGYEEGTLLGYEPQVGGVALGNNVGRNAEAAQSDNRAQREVQRPGNKVM